MAPDGLTGAQMAAIEATQAANASGTKTPRRRSVTRVFMGFAVVAVFVALLLCLRFFLRPGESDPMHIKREVLRDTPSR